MWEQVRLTENKKSMRKHGLKNRLGAVIVLWKEVYVFSSVDVESSLHSLSDNERSAS